MSTPIEFTSTSVDQTLQLGRQIGTLLQAGDVVCLSGDLGTGKTALTRGIGAGWGAQESITSPTFTLIHEHHRIADDQILYHIDSYRLHTAQDAWAIGLDDMLYGESAIVIEWPENILTVLPVERLWIGLVYMGENERQLTITATGARYQRLLDSLRDYLPD